MDGQIFDPFYKSLTAAEVTEKEYPTVIVLEKHGIVRFNVPIDTPQVTSRTILWIR